MSRRKKKKRRGEKLRPCVRCGQTVNFIRGKWVHFGKKKQGWHWANEDGSHHRCTDFGLVTSPYDEPDLAKLMGERC